MNIQHRPRKIRLSALLMIVAIIGIGAFQGYWLGKLYSEGRNDLRVETDIAFRDVIYHLQMQRFLKDSAFFGRDLPNNLFVLHLLDSLKGRLVESSNNPLVSGPGPSPNGTLSFDADSSAAGDKPRSIFIKKATVIQGESGITAQHREPVSLDAPFLHIVRYDNDTANATLSLSDIDSAYRKELLKYKIDVPYIIRRVQGTEKDLERSVAPGEIKTSFLFVGLSKAYAYQATFGSPYSYLFGRLKLPISASVLLLAFTLAAFTFMYRNLLQQQKLATIKNDFISNMTHELKTPIATVNVAVEALRHFGAMDNPERAKEYLDISALELHRLSMLVDKVLKLSMFESKEIDLNAAPVDLYSLSSAVIESMKLQLDKAGADIRLTRSGEGFTVNVDRTHMSSVLSNLLDNAIKYSTARPVITVHLSREKDQIVLRVSDNGIGIPAGYRNRVFEKFFRVPSGDHHNIKGYGLGLSYVHHIVSRHNGTISVESKEGAGSTFTIKLPDA